MSLPTNGGTDVNFESVVIKLIKYIHYRYTYDRGHYLFRF